MAKQRKINAFTGFEAYVVFFFFFSRERKTRECVCAQLYKLVNEKYWTAPYFGLSVDYYYLWAMCTNAKYTFQISLLMWDTILYFSWVLFRSLCYNLFRLFFSVCKFCRTTLHLLFCLCLLRISIFYSRYDCRCSFFILITRNSLVQQHIQIYKRCTSLQKNIHNKYLWKHIFIAITVQIHWKKPIVFIIRYKQNDDFKNFFITSNVCIKYKEFVVMPIFRYLSDVNLSKKTKTVYQ